MMSSVESNQVENKKIYRDRDGKQFVYKLAWQEEDGKWCTALGNDWLISSSILVFNGTHGQIVLSQSIKYVVK